MNGQTPYSIHTDVKFKPLELIDVQRLQAETKDQWFNQTLCQVNDCVSPSRGAILSKSYVLLTLLFISTV